MIFLSPTTCSQTTTVVNSQYYQTSQITCGINEQYSPCTQICPPTCDSPNPQCRVDCTRPSCNCLPGYVYSPNRQCIPANSCLQTQSSRCRFNIDCRHGSYCVNGFCGAGTSGVYTRTIVTSSSSSSSSSGLRHHRIQGQCSLDVDCEHRKVCINRICVFAEPSDSYVRK
uniref:TIL domain-containing protein n=1 Tax=Caenorhabditis tropicalis TaxID=1561998 RepID=A0A1I7SYJ9_9PELO